MSRESQSGAAHARMEWLDFKRIAPAANAALLALGQAAVDGGLDKGLLELVKLRASQINGCAFCLQHHLTIARSLGMPPEKLDLVAAWEDAGIYSPRERAALAWTEALTRVSEKGAPDDIYDAVAAQFSETELALLTSAISVINAWNRIAIGFRFSPNIPGRTAQSTAA